VTTADDLDAEENGDLLAVKRTLAQVRRDRDGMAAMVRHLDAENAELQRQLGILEGFQSLDIAPPEWTTAPPSGTHHAVACALLSDTHFDEVVRPEELDNLNAYNREIAQLRLRAFFDGVDKMAHHYTSNIEYDGLVLMLGGDMFSGDIHEELVQTNEDTMIGSVLHWAEELTAGITQMAEQFGRVHIPVVVGNHGRQSRKPRAKFRARDNFDWMLGHMLNRHFRADERVTFQIPETADCMVPVYGHKILLTHGDQTKGGAGIGGIWPPIMRLVARKRQRKAFDLMVAGHWHSYTNGPDFTINGSLKGWDEYAEVSNFGFEVPQQAMWLMTAEHGITSRHPIFVADREAEGW
jgi:hypothetical protein